MPSRQEILAYVLKYKHIYSSRDSSDSDSKTTDTPYKDWVKSSYQLAEMSKTLAECREAYLVSPFGSKPNKMALLKLTKLAKKSAETAKTPVEARNAQHDSPPDSEPERIALVRRKKLCLTPAQAMEEYVNSPLGSEERSEFLFLYIKLCNTVEQLEDVLGGLSRGSVAKIAVMEKLKQLQARDEQEKGREIRCLE